MELSFVDVDDVIDVNERLLAKLFKEILGVEVSLPIPRMTWQEAMDRFGSDKPDIRFGMELVDVSEVVKDCEFVVFKNALENGGSVRGINAKGQGAMPRKKIDKLVDFAKDFGAKGLAYIAIQEDGTVKSSFAKFMSEEEMHALIEAMGGENGDLLLFAADKNKVVWDVLGNLRLEIARQLEILDKGDYRFLWVTEFPLLEWNEEAGRYTAMHHPFTMPMEEDLDLLDTDPGKVRAKAYDIVLNGTELGGGSVRIFNQEIHPFTMPMEEDLDLLDTDPGKVRAKAYDIVLNGTELGGGSVRIFNQEIQNKMFEVLGFTREQAEEQFGFLLSAFKYGVPPHAGLAYGLDRLIMLMAKEDSIRDVIAKYGVPPHAGLAYGLDRLIMLMAKEDSIRDVIAFPKVKDASDLMTEAPAAVDRKQLEELGLEIAKIEE